MSEYLTTADVARELGVQPTTVRGWRTQSRPGERYAENPFPGPDLVLGNSVAWLSERLPEIREWASARPGRGVGGGRPRNPPKEPNSSVA